MIEMRSQLLKMKESLDKLVNVRTIGSEERGAPMVDTCRRSVSEKEGKDSTAACESDEECSALPTRRSRSAITESGSRVEKEKEQEQEQEQGVLVCARCDGSAALHVELEAVKASLATTNGELARVKQQNDMLQSALKYLTQRVDTIETASNS
eukprot:TRINITY_DN506_c2_g1_i3.p2 TRINITY_DN506_c2_g1~~TRINITY_DN506_c2_g1_i3.p2  ORF type:complete len:153 (-),score=68.50 TRINITY_DN506_c2_g1_i3:225-683(-)